MSHGVDCWSSHYNISRSPFVFREYVYTLHIFSMFFHVCFISFWILFLRQRVEREEREELRKKAIPNWKDRSFMPEELAGKLEQDRRTFQMKTVEVRIPYVAVCCLSTVCTTNLSVFPSGEKSDLVAFHLLVNSSLMFLLIKT